MPKLTDEQQREIGGKKLFEKLVKSPKGVRVTHKLTEQLADLPPGAWIFGELQIVEGHVIVSYEGFSK